MRYQRVVQTKELKSTISLVLLSVLATGIFLLYSSSVLSAYSENHVLSGKNYKHHTPQFDYLHLDREVNDMRKANKTKYQMFREGVSSYFRDDYTEAINILLPLAQMGQASSQFYIALMYDQGHGVIKNHKIAADWYKRAAKQGHLDAQYNLGIAFASGQGVSYSIKKAIFWWKKAATKGSVDAQYNLGMVYTTGKGIEPNASLAVKWWEKASYNGDAAAQFNLGVVYINGGKGVNQNLCKASKLWTISAEQGFDRAKSALRMLKSMKRYHNSCWGVTARKN